MVGVAVVVAEQPTMKPMKATKLIRSVALVKTKDCFKEKQEKPSGRYLTRFSMIFFMKFLLKQKYNHIIPCHYFKLIKTRNLNLKLNGLNGYEFKNPLKKPLFFMKAITFTPLPSL